ncbi:hypothetical protein D3C84_427980 [compost metagenome]
MPKFPKKRVTDYINKKIKAIEEHAKKLVHNELYGYLGGNEFEYEKVGGEFELRNIEFEIPKEDYSKYTTSNLYDLKFSVLHEGKTYIFETSNYYYYDHHDEFVVEDILKNVDTLLEKLKYLLEWEDYLFNSSPEEDSDEEDMTIDDVADSCGFYIDDDDHWIPQEENYFFDDINGEEIFRDNLDFKDGYYIYNDIDDNGRFYWKS